MHPLPGCVIHILGTWSSEGRPICRHTITLGSRQVDTDVRVYSANTKLSRGVVYYPLLRYRWCMRESEGLHLYSIAYGSPHSYRPSKPVLLVFSCPQEYYIHWSGSIGGWTKVNKEVPEVPGVQLSAWESWDWCLTETVNGMWRWVSSGGR